MHGVYIADRDQTQQIPFVIAHRQVADAAILHDRTDLVHVGAWRDADDVLGHHVADLHRPRIAAFADDARQHVALREHPLHLAVIHHHDRADAQLVHSLDRVEDGGGWLDDVN